MTKFLATASLLALAIPGTAHAGEVYVAVSGGVALPSDTTNEGTISPGLPATAAFPAIADGTAYSFDTELDNGWTAGGQIGYKFDNGIRLEIDGGYAGYDVKSFSNYILNGNNIGTTNSAILTRGAAAASNPTVNAALAASTGDIETYGAFVNALYEFDLGGIHPYFGGGVGMMVWDADYSVLGNKFTEDHDIELAYQGIGGIAAELSDHVDLFAEYKYRNTFNDSENVTLLVPGSVAVNGEQHLVSAGLRFRFGGPAAPMVAPPAPPPPVVRPVAPPPPPPPPPAPVARQCNTGPYIVFFDWDKSEVTAEAASVLNSAVTAYGDCGMASIMLAGHADRSGSTQYNVGLSERRNASVQTYLAGRGIPAARISSEAFGESRNRVATADGVRELQNRRVEITYGPGSGR